MIYLFIILSLILILRSIFVYRKTLKVKTSNQLIEEKVIFKLKTIAITFGQTLYQSLSRRDHELQSFLPNLYRNWPQNGVTYTMSYVDTQEDNPKIIVLLHGMPGSIADFGLFCHHFGDKYRLIVPQLPDFELSRTSGQFWHSSEERAELVTCFLRALSIDSVDCFVCHSGGNPVLLELIRRQQISIKSSVLLSPPGYNWLSSRELMCCRLMCRVASSWWKRNLFLVLVPDFVQSLFGVPKTLLKNCTKDEFFSMNFVALLSAMSIRGPQIYGQLVGRPTLFVFGQKDNLFPKWKFHKTLEWMDANHQSLFTTIGENGDYETDAKADHWIRVLDFRFGGHFCFMKFSEVFHKECEKFFEKVI